MAPTVFAAYTLPTSRAGSCPRPATAASASGKLAPHRMAAGNTANSARTPSTCRLIHGFCTAEGLIGQYGSDWLMTYAGHAMPTPKADLAPSECHARTGDARGHRRPHGAADAEAKE